MISAKVAPAPGQIDPLRLIEKLWPDVHLYDKQKEILYSVENNFMTVVPAANQMGKDFIGGLTVLTYFLRHWPCRIVTTSVKDDHLDVLWGEISRFFISANEPLDIRGGGPLRLLDREIQRWVGGVHKRFEYVKGMVSSPDKVASLQGHHAQYTLGVIDEASGVNKTHFEMMDGWAKKYLIISNCWDCDNEFKYAVEGKPGTDDQGGDIPALNGRGFRRKVISIPAALSPNVRYAEEEKRLGLEPSNKIIIPGVLTWEQYLDRRTFWDPIQQCIKLDAKFYKGKETLLYPPDWLDRAESIARKLLLEYMERRVAKGIGVDPAEGGDDTTWSIVDELGLIEQIAMKTPDTTVVFHQSVELIKRYIPDSPWRMMFDSGGGGKEHADRLREAGYDVRTVAFGEAASAQDWFRKYKSKTWRVDEKEQRYAYKNKRAEMYGLLRMLLDTTERGFGISSKYVELRRQLAPMPLMFDAEGRMRMLPKNKNTQNSKEQTLTELLGCSPDEADSLVVAVYSMMNEDRPFIVRAY